MDKISLAKYRLNNGDLVVWLGCRTSLVKFFKNIIWNIFKGRCHYNANGLNSESERDLHLVDRG